MHNSAAFVRTLPRFWSEWRDSNPRHPAPKAGALPTALHPDGYSDAVAVVVKHVVNGGFLMGFGFFCDGRKRRRVNGFRRWRVCERRESVHAPKAGALPTALHPGNIKLWDKIYHSFQIVSSDEKDVKLEFVGLEALQIPVASSQWSVVSIC